MVVIAHPDDEWWGLGGTLLKLSDMGNTLTIVMCTDGERGDGKGEERITGSQQMCEELGITFINIPMKANTLREYESLMISKLDTVIANYQPTTIITHHNGDYHLDHRALSRIIDSCSRNNLSISILHLETPFKTNFTPNFWIDIPPPIIELKEDLYRKYYTNENSLRKELSLDTIRIIASFRGLESGTEYAEGFILKHGVTQIQGL